MLQIESYGIDNSVGPELHFGKKFCDIGAVKRLPEVLRNSQEQQCIVNCRPELSLSVS